MVRAGRQGQHLSEQGPERRGLSQLHQGAPQQRQEPLHLRHLRLQSVVHVARGAYIRKNLRSRISLVIVNFTFPLSPPPSFFYSSSILVTAVDEKRRRDYRAPSAGAQFLSNTVAIMLTDREHNERDRRDVGRGHVPVLTACERHGVVLEGTHRALRRHADRLLRGRSRDLQNGGDAVAQDSTIRLQVRLAQIVDQFRRLLLLCLFVYLFANKRDENLASR